MQVDGTTLPSKVDVHNAVYSLHVARGAVPKVQFRTQETRRVYVLATLEHGQPLEKESLFWLRARSSAPSPSAPDLHSERGTGCAD